MTQDYKIENQVLVLEKPTIFYITPGFDEMVQKIHIIEKNLPNSLKGTSEHYQTSKMGLFAL